MSRYFHSASIRYAVALWLATVLALFVAFLAQLEPAQWAGITVWIMFIQNPRINYSKIIWWVFGTVVGALMAVALTACFSQAPELFLLSLAVWLAGCAAAATLVKSYRAYGVVLAGYTCAIVSMSAADHPDQVFQLAVSRVSCIFVGMAAAVLLITLLLPTRQHWRETLRHLEEQLKATLTQAAKALAPDSTHPVHFTWRRMVDRLSTLEHTLDMTTAESAGSRLHAAQARSLVATLFCLLARAQAVEIHLSRPGGSHPPHEVHELMGRARALLTACAEAVSATEAPDRTFFIGDGVSKLREELATTRRLLPSEPTPEVVSAQFILGRLDEILKELAHAAQDWAGLFGPWTARRASHLAAHRDYHTAFVYALRMLLAMALASAIWFITEWPAGSQFILFIAVVCSLLSLLDHAPILGFAFLKSALFCATMAYVETFWLLQKAEGFPVMALALGLFLLPAAYAYRHPRLHGSAVVSMLIFYGLTMPANQMNYDVSAFLNNGLALLSAAACGFFSFHAVPSLSPASKRSGLLRTIQNDLAQAGRGEGALSEQGWTSRMFDRLRLLHQTTGEHEPPEDMRGPENVVLTSLQLGLRQRRLRALLREGDMVPGAAELVVTALRQFRRLSRQPEAVADSLRSACARLQESLENSLGTLREGSLAALAEMREMVLLIETPALLYPD